MSAKKFSNGEKKVINSFNGVAKETAERCNLAPAYVRKLLTLDYIKEAIQAREDKENASGKNPLIADRQERQAFWTSVARGEAQVVKLVPKMKGNEPVLDDDGNQVMEEVKAIPTMNERLKAAELLGKSNADFVEKKEVSGPGGGPMEFKQKFETVEELEDEMKRRGLPVEDI